MYMYLCQLVLMPVLCTVRVLGVQVQGQHSCLSYEDQAANYYHCLMLWNLWSYSKGQLIKRMI